jgi:hypothetical protein
MSSNSWIVVPFCVLSHQNSREGLLADRWTIKHYTVKNRTVLHRVALSCPVLSCPVLSCPVLSCPVLSCTAPGFSLTNGLLGGHRRPKEENQSGMPSGNSRESILLINNSSSAPKYSFESPTAPLRRNSNPSFHCTDTG